MRVSSSLQFSSMRRILSRHKISRRVICTIVLVLAFSANLQGTRATENAPSTTVIGNELSDVMVGWRTAETYSGMEASKIRIITVPENQDTRTPARYELCRTFDEDPCLDAGSKPTWISILLPHCESKLENWCVEGLSISRRGSTPKSSKFIRQVQGINTPENQKLFYPRGGTISLWDASDSPNAGGSDTYAVMARVLMANFPEMKRGVRPGARLSVHILPYKEVGNFESSKKVPFSRMALAEITNQEGARRFQITGGDLDCVWTEDGKCGLPVDFEDNTFASISIRLRNDLTGWLMGRMEDPQVKIAKIDNDYSKLTVSANVVQIPILNVSIPKKNLTPKLRETWLEDGYGNPDPNAIDLINGDSPGIFEIIDSWRDVAHDTSAGLSTAWNFTSMTGGGGSPCLLNPTGLQGIVSTNAMGYDGIAPSFEEGSLNYQVAGFHYNPDGSEFLGTYDLLINRKVADCLYGLRNLPVKASVSVVDDGKLSKISTSTFAEIGVGNDSWLKVGVKGFTFSAPKIRVKFSQSTKPLICIKGTITKKITGPAPKCPSGFKKK